jgi:altronate dehydratase small subunit
VTTAFQIHVADNVATLLADAAAGEAVALRGATVDTIPATGPVAMGHKIALFAIAAGEPIVKFGIPIGTATESIGIGAWVHLHNCTSGFDERSGAFDLETGAAKDIVYV